MKLKQWSGNIRPEVSVEADSAFGEAQIIRSSSLKRVLTNSSHECRFSCTCSLSLLLCTVNELGVELMNCQV